MFFLLWKLVELSVSAHHKYIVHFAITLCVMAKRFGEALNESEILKRLRNSVPKSTKYKTQWGVRVFETWQRERSNGNAREELNVFGLDVLSNIESLGSDMLSMSEEGLNFWLSKFVEEVRDKDSKRYPEKTLYQLICCIKRHYEENVFNKNVGDSLSCVGNQLQDNFGQPSINRW